MAPPGGSKRYGVPGAWANAIAHQLEIPINIYPFCFFPIRISSRQFGQIVEKSTDKDYFQWKNGRIKTAIS